jgi:hypothetical protein
MASFFSIAVLLTYVLSAEAALRGHQVSEKDVENTLFAELSGSFRGTSAQKHIADLEAELRPMFAVVPRNADGSLPHTVVRYTLHRFFVHRHGWFIRGLEPNASVNQSAQGLQNLQDWVPAYLQRFIELIQEGHGINLRELAIIAATLEDLIHKEAIAHLQQAYDAIDLPTSTQLDEAQAHQVLEIWMMIYMLGGRFKVRGKRKVLRAHEIFTRKIKDWAGVQDWVHGIQLELFPRNSTPTLDFNATVRVVEEVGRRYATYNSKACGNLKSELISIESKKAGRVRLTEFYKKGLSGGFDFTEKLDYLRVLGALDDTDPRQSYVIVPNYVGARPNCLVTSTFYVICCRNECEDLLGALEEKIAGEAASPDKILKIVSELSTGSVIAPRSIPANLQQRLQSVADINGGSVPLHGRLFAQWMHHAFPRECPYPHGSGIATTPMTPDEWMEESGQTDSKASKEEMITHINNDNCSLDEPIGEDARRFQELSENDLPWDNTEELLHVGSDMGEFSQAATSQPRSAGLGGLAAVSSFGSSIIYMACKYVLARRRSDKIDVIV